MTRSRYFFAWFYALACAWLVARAVSRPRAEPARTAVASRPATALAPVANERAWFRQAKPFCNTVEVATLEQHVAAPPATVDGAGYHAACFALAGRVDQARQVIDALPAGDRLNAVAIVFDVAHPVADAGDDRSAGPIMEMVVDYWPNHYMALYHAGMSEYMLGQRQRARHNLTEFLKYYHESDGWTSNARAVLRRLDSPVEAPIRPAEPGA